jgi:hypothetical protein
LKERYPNVAFTFSDSSQPFASVVCPVSEMGRLDIYDDGDEATIDISEITHGHFNPYETMSEPDRDKWVTEAVTSFLDALFADRVLLYRTPNRHMGGWQVHDDRIDRTVPLSGFEHRQCFVWSGAIATD